MLRRLSEEHDISPWFNDEDLNELLAVTELPPEEGKTDPDEVPEAPEQPITKPGDLWILGNHRLLCGDSTNIQHVERLMDGKKADFVYMDPPYGMKLDTNYAQTAKVKGKSYKSVHGDFDDYDPRFLLEFFNEAREQFWWGADYYCQTLPKDGSWVVWDKKKEDLDESIGSGFELCWSINSHKRQLARFLWSGFTAKEANEQRQHPTQKPVALAEWFFDRWGKAGDLVVDLYGGSGSTLIACEKTSRHCRMMELDPAYCDVIRQRWEDFTGNTAICHPADSHFNQEQEELF
jgi:DNA modification methylase